MRWIFLIAAVGLVALAVFELTGSRVAARGEGRTPAPAGSSPATASPGNAAQAASFGEAAAASSTDTNRPNSASYQLTTVSALPPDTVPLAQSIEALSAAMRAGSREATLRVLRQTEECRRFANASQILDMMVGVETARTAASHEGQNGTKINISDATVDASIQFSAEAVVTSEALCAAFEDPEHALRFEAQWRAALMGELEGLLRFSLDPAISGSRAYQQVDRIQRYTDRAHGFLIQAMAQHSAQAVSRLMNAFDPGAFSLADNPDLSAAMRRKLRASMAIQPLRQITVVDAEVSYRYAQLCEQVCDDRQSAFAEAVSARLRRGLDPVARLRAEGDAARLRERHFPDAERAPMIPGLPDYAEMGAGPPPPARG